MNLAIGRHLAAILKQHFLALLIFFTLPAAAQLSVPVTIQEMTYPGVSGVARTSEPVTLGLPLAKGLVPCASATPASCSGISKLGLTGVTVGQFRCLVEWEDQSCKWVLVDTQVSLAGGGVNASVVLNNAGAGSFGGSNLATDNGATIAVNTGGATFTIRKANFNILDQVVVGGTTIVASGASTGLAIVGPAPGGTSCGTCTTTYTSSNDAASTAVIEENGPVRAVIKADGAHKDSSGNTYMRWTVRLYFYKGKSYVRANVSLRNADVDSSAFNTSFKGFSAYELRVTPSLGTGRAFSFGNDTATPTTGNFAGAENAYLYQAYTNHMEHPHWVSAPASIINRSGSTYAQNGYQITHGSTTLLSNAAVTAASKMFGDVADSVGVGVLAGVYLGGEYWPKSVQLQNGGSEIRIGIWPDQTLYTGPCSVTPCAIPYYQAWPQHSIHDVYLNFHNTALASPQSEFFKQQFSLVGRASVDYYNSTGAMFNSLMNPSEEDTYYRNLGMSCCLADLTPNVFRYYAWAEVGGGNQSDFGLAYLRNFLERGETGRLMWSLARYRFNAEQAFPRSDGFNWRSTTSSLDSWGFPTATSTNSGNANRAWIDQEHAHWYGMMDYYFITGDETIHDAINDGPKDRFLNTKAALNNGLLWNERAIGGELVALARMYQLARGTNDPDAPGFLTVADQVLNQQVWPDLSNPQPAGSQTGQGTARNRGLHYGCCAYDNWPNPPASSGPGGAGTARVDVVFMHSVLSQGMYEIASARGSTWSNGQGTDQYNRALDYSYGMAHWMLTEGFIDDGVCNPVQNCGFTYIISPDYTQSLGPQIGQETIWTPFFMEQFYKGDLAFWQRRLNIQLRQVDAANPGGSWDENGNYAVNQAIYSALHPGTVVAQDVTIAVTNNGGGSYTISWTPPAGVIRYRLKHFAGKQIVDDLGWNPGTQTSSFSQSSFNPFWSAPATRQQPAAGASSITVTLDDISGTALAATGENFALKAYVSSGTIDATPPTVSISAPASGATVNGAITVSATASDNVAVAGVQFMLDAANLGAEDTAAPYTISWNTTAASNGTHTLLARARDAAGNTSTASITVTVNNPDLTPPSVSIVTPVQGAIVSGTVGLTATASDNVGVVGVQFQLDGVNLGAEDTAAPYGLAWNTTTAVNGSHTLSAVARDAAGNKATASVTITVANSPPPASVLGIGVDSSTRYLIETKELSPIVTCLSCFQGATDVIAGQTLEIRVRPASNPSVADAVILKQGSIDGTVASVSGSTFVLQPASGTAWPANITVLFGNVTQFVGFASANGPITAGQKVSVRGLLMKASPSGVQLIAGSVQLRQ